MPTTSSSANVRRPLGLSTPVMQGDDVRALQGAMRSLMAQHKIDWLPLAVDGQVGPQTIHAARFLTWVLGLGGGHRLPIQKRKVIAKATQTLLRNPEKRSAIERGRSRRRGKRLAKIRTAQDEGPKAAVAYARSFVGTTEHPTGSNGGPLVTNDKGQKGGVTFWEGYWGLGACFWCLCFACYCVKAIGGAKVSGNCTYSVAIEEMARAHEDGWVEVPIADRRVGDILTWKFDGPSSPSDHGELVASAAEDIGGNTSSEGGSQSNGGGVFSKQIGSATRPLSAASMCCRPLYS